MTDFFVYFSIFVLAISIIYIIVGFFDESKLTEILSNIFKDRRRKKIAEAENNENIEGSDIVPAVESAEEEKSEPINVRAGIGEFFKDLKEALNAKLSPNLKLFLKIGLIALSTRIIIYIFGYFAGMLDRGVGADFEDIWVRWDAQHYLRIAKEWYTGGSKDTEIFIVFFPLFPFLTRVLNLVVGSPFISSIILSNTFLIVGCFYMYKLFEFEYDKKTAWNGVKYLLIVPVSFFLCIPYAESLFIMLSVMTFYYLRKEKWLLAAFLGMIAATSRLHGVLLIIPFIIEIFVQKRVFENLKERNFKTAFKDIFGKGLISLLIPAGLGIYLILNQIVTGDWFKFLYWQKNHWNNGFQIFYDGSIPTILGYINSKPSTELASLWMPQIIAILIAFLAIIYAIRMKMRVSYFTYFTVYVFISISQTWLISSPRYIMAGFPLYLVAANFARRKSIDLVLTFASILGLMYCIFAYVNGKQIF